MLIFRLQLQCSWLPILTILPHSLMPMPTTLPRSLLHHLITIILQCSLLLMPTTLPHSLLPQFIILRRSLPLIQPRSSLLPHLCNSLHLVTPAGGWGGQIGNSVPDGTPIELFKFRSLSGYIIYRSGGPIAWKSIRQKQTALSSCEAEVIATNECVTKLLSVFAIDVKTCTYQTSHSPLMFTMTTKHASTGHQQSPQKVLNMLISMKTGFVKLK